MLGVDQSISTGIYLLYNNNNHMKMVIKFMYILSTFHLFVFFNDYNVFLKGVLDSYLKNKMHEIISKFTAVSFYSYLQYLVSD